MHFNYLLPIDAYTHGFSTLQVPNDQAHKLKLSLIRLDDKKLGVHKISSKTSHKIVKPPLPRKANTTVLAAGDGKEVGVDDGGDDASASNSATTTGAIPNAQSQGRILTQGDDGGASNAAQTRFNTGTSSGFEDDGDDKHIYPPSVPLPKEAWEAFYPKGSINPTASLPGGFSFYLGGPTAFANALNAGATEVILSYRVMLDPEWDWVKGGKLPGLAVLDRYRTAVQADAKMKGVNASIFVLCGGKRPVCLSQTPNVNFLNRAQGKGELYTYLPLTENNAKRLGAVPPYSKQNPDYGFTVGRGAFSFDHAKGQWLTLAFRIKLNTIGQENGEMQLWANGKSVIMVEGLSFRDSDESKIKGMHFQTFFGGHTDDWASPKDQRAWFADITGAIIN